ncbi:hypothetical protein F5887DRAFT_1082433 [Amanita rubescens]|nr:hypothetical protein F5887DRAFT_1082433 [Amanita rubescens]
MLFQSPKYGLSFTTNTNALLPPTLSKHQDAIEYAESVLGLVRFYRAQITGHAQGFLPPDLNSLTSSSCNFKGMFYYTNVSPSFLSFSPTHLTPAPEPTLHLLPYILQQPLQRTLPSLQHHPRSHPQHLFDSQAFNDYSPLFLQPTP